MVDFKALETFLWVVTLGSFRGAAQKLNTTQPAVSQRIAQLGHWDLDLATRELTASEEVVRILEVAEAPRAVADRPQMLMKFAPQTGKVEVVTGAAKLRADKKVEVNGQVYEAKNILISTGSSPAKPPISPSRKTAARASSAARSVRRTAQPPFRRM